ncbi:NUDIX hydrolase [Snodgrassella gandavensis]|uniref:NUDIX hydrolase n=1 Tax=Snodgrassella gandavensis TaxID=2946698 RepID=UPI001EF4F7CE|nr:NUDIX hydrolase [Snodgrassella gandavensis]
MNLTETKITSKEIYRGSFLNVFEDTVSLPNGKQAQRVVVQHPGAAAVLAVTAEQKVVLVRQWRYPVGEALLEIPAGKLDGKNEDPADAALRELAEETPYTAAEVKLIHTFYTVPGFGDEKMYLYLAENVQPNSALAADEDEILEPLLLSRDEVRTALANNQIHDGKTLIALQYWLLYC